MKIKFNSLEDFIHEIEKDRDRIERGIMRVNTITQPSQMSPAFCLLFVQAECIIERHIVEYREWCGDLWGKGFESDDKARAKEKDRREKLDHALARLGITDIRGGTIEETAKA